MRKFLLPLILLILIFNCAYSQLNNVRISYQVTTAGTKADFYVSTTSGTANLSGLNFGLFLQSSEVNVGTILLDATPAASNLGWAVAGNTTTSPTPTSYIKDGNTYNTLYEMQIIDGNNGATLNVSTTPKLFATITMDLSPGAANTGGMSSLAETSDPPSAAFVIFDSNFTPADVVGTGILSQVLPIKLKDFVVDRVNGKRASDLRWTSSSEVNSDYYQIERSEDGFNWTKSLGTVKAAGNSHVDLNYQFVDDQLPNSRNQQDVYYYRLKMVDLDGSFEYSSVRSVRFDNESGVDIIMYPNPTSSRVYVNMSTNDDINENYVDAHVFDLSGKLVLSQKVSTNGITEIDFSNLPTSAYNINITHNNKTYTNKVIRSN